MRKIKVRGRYSSSFKKTMCIAFNVGTLIFYTPHAKTEPLLATIEVQANTNAVTLGFDQISTTGSRTGVTNQELPASIETIDHKMMQERGTTQISDAVTQATGMTALSSPGNGGLSFSSRGFTGVNSVGVAEDGIRVQTAAGTQNYPDGAWGYERIDVIRGPASVVFGTGTVGATVNAIRKEPSRTSSHEIMASIGMHGSKKIGIGSTGALNEIATYRIDAYGFKSDGYVDLGKSKGGKFMSKFRLQPSSTFRLDFTADYSKAYPPPYFGSPYDNNKKIVESLRKRNYISDDTTVRHEDTRLKAKAEWQALDWLTISDEVYHLIVDRHWRYVGGHKLDQANDTITRSSYLQIYHDLKQTGNRLEGRANLGKHKLVVGWEMAHINFQHTNNSPYRGSSVISATNPIFGKWHSPDPVLPKFTTTTKTNALYIEDAWKWNDHWLLLAGLRRDFLSFSRRELQTGVVFSSNLTGTSGRLGLTYHLIPNTSIYALFSMGSDPITSPLTMNQSNANFRLTTGKQTEFGIKQNLGNGSGEWSAALFRIKKDDIITRDPNDPTISIQGGSMHSQGVELTAAFALNKNIRIEGNYTHLISKFDELNESVGGRSVSRAGNRPSNVPLKTGSLWGHYQKNNWQVSLGLRYVGNRFADNANTIRMDSYTVMDASLAWNINKKTKLRFLVQNLSDKIYATTTNRTQFILGEPRKLNLIVESKF